MKPGQQNQATNVVRLRTRSNSAMDPAVGRQDSDIVRLLDLSRYEHSRPADEDYGANMRANIAAMVLLAVLVFIATEDFCKLERANLCATSISCFN
jgi:hypothetical protein